MAVVEPLAKRQREREAFDQIVASIDERGVRPPRRDDNASGELPPLTIKRRGRAKTIAMKRLSKEELQIGALLYPERSYWRPASRGECANVSRPCPYVSCKYHLYIDVHPQTGNIKVNFPDREVWELEHSCALDVAEQDGLTLEEVGEILNLGRERIRQVEVLACEHMRR